MNTKAKTTTSTAPPTVHDFARMSPAEVMERLAPQGEPRAPAIEVVQDYDAETTTIVVADGVIVVDACSVIVRDVDALGRAYALQMLRACGKHLSPLCDHVATFTREDSQALAADLGIEGAAWLASACEAAYRQTIDDYVIAPDNAADAFAIYTMRHGPHGCDWSRSATLEDAVAGGWQINKFADPIEGALEDISIDDALEIAREDPRLIWLSRVPS
jgi:hypothetical protein